MDLHTTTNKAGSGSGGQYGQRIPNLVDLGHVKADGVEYLKRNAGGKNKVLLMIYTVIASTFTNRVLQAYRGNTTVVVGTQNANRYTGFSDCTTKEWFEKEMAGWELDCRIPMPSFAGNNEALYVRKRKT